MCEPATVVISLAYTPQVRKTCALLEEGYWPAMQRIIHDTNFPCQRMTAELSNLESILCDIELLKDSCLTFLELHVRSLTGESW